MAISRQDILDAIETLVARGDKLTLVGVRTELGRGSNATILPILREWKSSQQVQMPDNAQKMLQKFGTKFWVLLNEETEKIAKLSREKESSALTKNDLLTSELSDKKSEIENLNTQIKQLELKVNKQKKENAFLVNKLLILNVRTEESTEESKHL